MADMAAGDVTYTLLNKEICDNGNKRFRMTIAFGNGSLTYPSGGVPLTKASMGVPNVVKQVNIYGPASANGYVYKYDAANNKIRIYQGDNNNASDSELIELVAATAAPAAATLYCEFVGW